MPSKYQLNNMWGKLTLARGVNESIKLFDGERLTDTEFAVLCLIAHHPDTTIAKIHKHPYFRDLGISTIKRSIGKLTKENLISAKDGLDRRERLLNVIEVEQ